MNSSDQVDETHKIDITFYVVGNFLFIFQEYKYDLYICYIYK